MVTLQHGLAAAVEPLNHAVGLRRSWRGQPVLDPKIHSELIKLMFPRCCPLAQTKQAAGELFFVTRSEWR